MRKENILKLRSCILILAGGAIIGYLLLVLSFSFNGKHFEEHMHKSALVFKAEGGYPNLGMRNSTLDNFTDALMLETASYRGDESPFEKAAASYRNAISGKGSPHEQIVALHLDEIDGEAKIEHHSYARYWHGYVVFLRPVLEFMSYNWIRKCNTILQSILYAIIIVLLVKELSVAAIPFLVMTAFFVPEAINKSIQYSTSTYVILLAVMVILNLYNKILQEKKHIELFLIIGMATSYLDLLTFPSVTLSLPLCVLFLLKEKSESENISLKSKLIFLFSCCLAWLVGYGGMWASKWIIAFIFQGKEFVRSTIGAIEFRSSANYNEIHYGRLATIFRRTRECFYNAPYFIIFAILCIFQIIGFVKKIKNDVKNKNIWAKCFEIVIPYIFISLIPCAWIFVMCNHAGIHWFTFRNFAPISFIVMMCCEELNRKIKVCA